LGVWWLAIAFLAYLACLKLLGSVVRMADLKWLRHAALTASVHEPDPHQMEQRVNWWELLRAGFQPTAPPGCKSNRLRLAGRLGGSSDAEVNRIPVFKKRHCTAREAKSIALAAGGPSAESPRAEAPTSSLAVPSGADRARERDAVNAAWRNHLRSAIRTTEPSSFRQAR